MLKIDKVKGKILNYKDIKKLIFVIVEIILVIVSCVQFMISRNIVE